MTVEVFAADEQSTHPVDTLRWVRLARSVLLAEGVKGEAELSLLFVDEQAMSDLNKRFARPGGTSVEWLSRDPAVPEAFEADPETEAAKSFQARQRIRIQVRVQRTTGGRDGRYTFPDESRERRNYTRHRFTVQQDGSYTIPAADLSVGEEYVVRVTGSATRIAGGATRVPGPTRSSPPRWSARRVPSRGSTIGLRQLALGCARVSVPPGGGTPSRGCPPLPSDSTLLRVVVSVAVVLSWNPSVAGGRVPLVLSLTSPAGRPIQTTRDLPGFWKGSWAAVQVGCWPRTTAQNMTSSRR